MKNKIGLNQEKVQELSEKLNDLLANYQLFYQNVRGFHWNIKGEKFFELHIKFEEFYDDAVLKVDEIAERILTLGGTPLHRMEDYLEISTIKSIKSDNIGKEAVGYVIDNFSTLIQKERVILDLSDQADDEGTNSLMSDYISQTEKTLWMLNAYMRS
ncbi:DNA starvation/stationary phase protection protein [Putridiphycobacter roseus]|uniref:DNA starvation/stationary phase protection protein n=1 Tax=Putridiphycobacter roseus TaxID=2219161 RepID=A0A2W1MXB3_9FLAO|nr:DNA starvation/stationary phase protection protein [Putridiphycobacter roseus]PZE16004.1 DNA starvation/stationary phase protection protein [Putridiphycobacter roseus]